MKKVITVLLAAMTIGFFGCQYFNPSPEQIEAVDNLALTAAQIASMYRQDDGVTRVALCIGVSRGYAGSCPGADLDAVRDARIYESIGFDRVITLLDENATRENIINSAIDLNTGLTSNDFFVVKFSSHGGASPNGTQYACTYDGPFNDFDVWRLYCDQPAGVRNLFSCDTCHSGSMFRTPYDYGAGIKNRIRNAAREGETFDGSLLYIGACSDLDVAYGNAVDGGQLSITQIECLPPYSTTYDSWTDNIKLKMPANQEPVITKVGSPDFGYQPVFY